MKGGLRDVSVKLLLPAVLLVVWGIATAGDSSFYWPPLTQSISAFRDVWLSEAFFSHAVPTILRLLLGTAIGMAAAIVVGLLIGTSRRLQVLLDPYVEFFRSLPIPALIPLALVLLGIGSTMSVTLVAWGCFWPVLVNNIDGVKSLDQTHRDTAKVYGIKGFNRLRRVTIPASLPQTFAGMRVGLATGLAVLIVIEMFASPTGIGYVTVDAQNTFDIPKMWAGIFLLAILGVVVNLVFTLAEDKLLRWHRGWRS